MRSSGSITKSCFKKPSTDQEGSPTPVALCRGRGAARISQESRKEGRQEGDRAGDVSLRVAKTASRSVLPARGLGRRAPLLLPRHHRFPNALPAFLPSCPPAN